MGLVNIVISTVAKCLDVVCVVLDLNFVVVHSLVRTLLAFFAFINNLPTLLLTSVLELGNFLALCLMSMADATTNAAQSTVTMLASVLLALEGLLEGLKMVGYLSMHVLLRGKEHLCRALLWLLEGCGIAVSLLVYFTNTVVNFVLIATQNVYLAVVSVLQTVSSPFQMVLELTLTCFTFLYSALAGTSAILWSPCKLVLDFVGSLVHMFISIFILNVYGLVLTITIALTTTAYLNPELTRQTTAQVMDYLSSIPSLRRLYVTLRRLALSTRRSPILMRVSMQHLRRLLHHIHILERRLWQQLSGLSSQVGQVLRAQRPGENDDRVQGDGNTQEERRGPPDGRAVDGLQQERRNSALPSSSTDRPLKKASPSSEAVKPLPADDLLTLLKEQEERKKCVICQDCTKTVVLLPCRHLCLCRECTNILLRQPIYQQNCPLCRHMILNTMDVYL